MRRSPSAIESRTTYRAAMSVLGNASPMRKVAFVSAWSMPRGSPQHRTGHGCACCPEWKGALLALAAVVDRTRSRLEWLDTRHDRVLAQKRAHEPVVGRQ